MNPLPARSRERSSVRRDSGSTSLTTVLLTPVFVVVAFAAFQAAMWSHARTEARVIARDTAALVARSGADPGDAQDSAVAILLADTNLGSPTVSVERGPRIVTVVVTGRAPGIVRGTSSSLTISEAIPIEGWTP